MRRRPGLELLVVAALAAITIAAYRGASGHSFLDWDDGTYVRENLLVLGRHYRELLRAVISNNYHPLTMISLAMNVAIPLSARPFIVTNVALHAVNTVLVFWLIRRLSGRLPAAALGALLFGIHPMHVESVAWISERKDVLYAGFFLAGAIAYDRHLERRSRSMLALCFACFVLSCLSKGMAVSFPLAMIALDIWHRRPLLEPRGLMEKLPFLAVALLFGLVAVDVQAGGDFHGLLQAPAGGASVLGRSLPAPALNRLTLTTYAFMMYPWKLIVPTGLCALVPYPTPAEASGLAYRLAPLFLIGALALAAWDLRRTRVMAFGLGWYLATVVFVLQWIPVGPALMADRYTYLPHIGLAFVWGVGVQAALDRNRPLGVAVWCASAAVAVLLFGWTQRQVETWKDGVALWTQAIQVHPQSALAYVWRGGSLWRSGRIDEARRDYQTAARLGNRSAPLFDGLGCVYGSAGYADSAVTMFDRAISIDPSVGRYYYSRGLALAMLGRHDEARRDLDQALALAPALATEVLRTRGALRAQAGDYRGAVADLDRVIAAGGAPPEVLLTRGLCRLQLGDRTGAVTDLRETLRRDPANLEARARLEDLDPAAPP